MEGGGGADPGRRGRGREEGGDATWRPGGNQCSDLEHGLKGQLPGDSQWGGRRTDSSASSPEPREASPRVPVSKSAMSVSKTQPENRSIDPSLESASGGCQ